MRAKSQTMRAQNAPRASSNLNLELPSLSFDSESLTAGTNIPAPERDPSPAPALKKPSKRESYDPLRSHPTTPDNSSPAPGGELVNGHQNGAGPTSQPDTTQMANNNNNGSVVNPGMKRPHHVRRLLSMRSLSQTFANHGRTESNVSGMSGIEGSDFGPPSARSRTPSIFGRSSTSTWGRRPESRSGASTIGGTEVSTEGGRQKLRKRMSGAFWSRRSSMTMTRVDESPNEAAAAQRKKTPPPQLPTIGELKVGNQLKNQDGGFLGGDDMFKGIEYKREV